MKSLFTLVLFSLLSINAFAQLPNVLILSAADSSYMNDVASKLQGTSLFNSVSTFDMTTGSPTLSYLNQFNAVFVFSDDSPADGDKIGDTLAAYIEGGGGVVNAVFSILDGSIEAGFTNYQLIIGNDQDDGTEYTLGTIDVPSSPIMQGVTTFDGGSSSYRTTDFTLASGTTTIAEWSDGVPLVVTKDNVGAANAKRVDLNFYPPSSDARSDFWTSSTNGALLMANSLVYVATPTTVTATQSVKNVAVNSAYPNPNNGEFTLSLNAQSDMNTTVKLMDMYGKEVYSSNVAFVSGANNYEIATKLQKGMYVLNIAGQTSSVGKIIVE